MVADASPRDAPLPRMVFLWESFGPHHVDRCEACAEHFAGRYKVCGVEIATFDANYEWRGSIGSEGFRKVTLFPGVVSQKIGAMRCFFRIVRACLRLRAKYIFFCNYNLPAIFFSAVVLRLLGRRLITMQDSKFDDKQRYLVKEIVKSLLYAPYQAALAAGGRSKAYLTFLGLPEDRVIVGYDTVSVERVRALAETLPAPDGVPHAARHFTIVARFVPKKNLSLALDAYAAYAARHPDAPRDLNLCGSGELEGELRQQAERLGLKGVHFRGYLQEREIARVLGSTLALILPSVEEQHGLVINEALAMGVPVLVSDNCGARDLLVRSGVNGFVFEPDNADGLAHFMAIVDEDIDEWTRLAAGARQFQHAADTTLFVDAVEQVLTRFAPGRQPIR
ncbi:MAG TPA: glycosyltransferase [Stellaceae bacterium]|nr:glycosyltransferase [Stellaceae bacterium]